MVQFLFALGGTVALAQGFDGQRHLPPTGSAGGLAVQRTDIPATGSAALFGSAAFSPVIFRRNGDIVSRPLRTILVFDATGSIALRDRLELGLAVPVAPVYQGDPISQPTYRFAAGPGIGDLRIVPKLAILGSAGEDGLRLGLSVPVRVPTGDEDALRGSGEAAIEPTLLVGGRIGPLGLHATGGFRIRPGLDEEDLVGQEVTYGLAIVLTAIDGEDGGLDVLLEGVGAIDVDRPGPELTDYPLELLGGLAWRPARDWTLSGGVGPGLTNGLGTPDARITLGVRFAPLPESDAHDEDGDGIRDERDECPRRPEDRDGFRDRDGCPDPDDDHFALRDLGERRPPARDESSVGAPSRHVALVTKE